MRMHNPSLTLVRCVSACSYIALTIVAVIAATLAFDRQFGRAAIYVALGAAFATAFPVYFAVQRWRNGQSILPSRLPAKRVRLCVALNIVGLVALVSMIIGVAALRSPVTPDQATPLKAGLIGYLAVLLTAVMNEVVTHPVKHKH